jgi:hypothetical protein
MGLYKIGSSHAQDRHNPRSFAHFARFPQLVMNFQ